MIGPFANGARRQPGAVCRASTLLFIEISHKTSWVLECTIIGTERKFAKTGADFLLSQIINQSFPYSLRHLSSGACVSVRAEIQSFLWRTN